MFLFENDNIMSENVELNVRLKNDFIILSEDWIQTGSGLAVYFSDNTSRTKNTTRGQPHLGALDTP